MGRLKIIKAGLSSSIQDKGRYGYQSKGVSVAGAMDQIALKLANGLVGNPLETACIEMTLTGDTIVFDEDTTIAICGGDFNFKINNRSIEINKSIQVISGDCLSSDFALKGLRAYLAVRGGFKLNPVLGSLSTSEREGLGGLGGCKLTTGDQIEYHKKRPLKVARRVPDSILQRIYSNRVISYTVSPEIDRFTKEGIDVFSASSYTIKMDSNRMGYRLEGPSVSTSSGNDMISGAVNFGSIQVPGNGQPIVMMADRQTVGGYVKIGQVIQSDLPYLSQKKPGDAISFKTIEVDQAIIKWKNLNTQLLEWVDSLDLQEEDLCNAKRYLVKVGQRRYSIRVSESE